MIIMKTLMITMIVVVDDHDGDDNIDEGGDDNPCVVCV